MKPGVLEPDQAVKVKTARTATYKVGFTGKKIENQEAAPL